MSSPGTKSPNRAVDHFDVTPTQPSHTAGTYWLPSATYAVFICAYAQDSGSSSNAIAQLYLADDDTGTGEILVAHQVSENEAGGHFACVSFIVPAGKYVKVDVGGGDSLVVTEVPIA